MICKTFEVRDRKTFIPVMAVQLGTDVEVDRYLMARSGFGMDTETQSRYVILIKLVDFEANYDVYRWRNRRFSMAHQYIIGSFNDLNSGSVVDVEFILGETSEPKKSERITVGGLS